MPLSSSDPYSAFNFLVNLGEAVRVGSHGGFQEVSGTGIDLTWSEHHDADGVDNRMGKVPSLARTIAVTLRRGVIDALVLARWQEQTTAGDHDAIRTVTIQLQKEGHTGLRATWRLRGARLAGGVSAVNARSSDVAIEELVLTCEQLEFQ
jgi:phage tail-like protein